MKYLVLVCADETVEDQVMSEGGDDVFDRDASAWLQKAGGRRVLGNALQPVSDSTCVRVRDGEVLITDGPFAETNEQIRGFDVLECADLDEALELLRTHPVARYGTLELRPFWS